MPSPTPGANPITDLIAQYFGGPYSAADHGYIASTIAGVGTWKRSWAKLDDFTTYVRGMTPGTQTGSIFIVHESEGIDRRLTLPAVQGRKHTSHVIELYGYFWSTVLYAEDIEDAVYAVRSAIVTALRADPTVGTGGLDAGWFHVGVPDEHGGGGDITWIASAPVTTNREGTKMSLSIHFEAHEVPTG